MPVVSVVIVNYNGRHHLERCLPALLGAPPAVPIEVVVVDNASTDGSDRWLAEHQPTVRVLTMPGNLGFGEANRRGVEAAHGEYVAFLNNDTVVTAGWLDSLQSALEADPAIAAACATLRLLDRPELLNARGGGMTCLAYGFDIDYLAPTSLPAEVVTPVRDVLFPTFAAALMRKRDFLACGGFDRAYFMYHEDVDLGWRLWLLGRRVVVCEDSVVYHAFGGTTRSAGGLAWRERLGARHALRSILKHYQLRSLVRLARPLLELWWRSRAFARVGDTLAWNLIHLPGTLAARWRTQRRRTVPDRALFEAGLIGPVGVPPPPPQLPHQAEPSTLVERPVLEPGAPSAVGRLGPGWYQPESANDVTYRWTCGHATCRLRVAPGAAGRLVVEARAPGAPGGAAEVTVACGGSRVAARVGAAWTRLELAVQAGADGLLEVTVSGPTFRPHQVARNWDWRRVGCAVQAVRFHDACAAHPRPPATVSVIIPTYNRWPILVQTLEALAIQSHAGFEAIVVDDGSTDGTWEELCRWQESNAHRLRLLPLHQENARQGQARNLGVRRATGELILFLGDDIVPSTSLVAEHLAAHSRLGAPAAVFGFVDWHRDGMRVTPFLDFVNRDGQQFAFGWLEDGREAPFTCFYTSNVSVPRMLLGTDPFDRSFTSYGWEDVEVGYRLTRRGLPLIYRRAAAASHLHPMRMMDFVRRQLHVGTTLSDLLRLHPELESMHEMPPASPPPALGLADPLMPALTAIAAAVDRLGLPLPASAYRSILLAALLRGRRAAAGAKA